MAQILDSIIAGLQAEGAVLSSRFISATAHVIPNSDQQVQTCQKIYAKVVAELLAWLKNNGEGCLQNALPCSERKASEKQVLFCNDIAREAREAHVKFETFALVLKVLRGTLIDYLSGLVDKSASSSSAILCVHFFFDELEIGALREWHKNETDRHKRRLRKARKSVIQEKKRYMTIFQRIAEPAYVVDDNLRIVDANQACMDFLVKEVAELRGQTCCEVLGHPSCHTCVLKEAQSRHASCSSVEDNITVLGERKSVVLTATFLGDVGENMSGSLVIIQDMTEKKQIERALKESEEKYRTLIENVPDAVWRVDQKGNLIFISPNIKKLTGYSPEEFTKGGPRGRAERIHPEDVGQVKKEFNQLFFLNKKFDIKYRFRRKDGVWRWFHDRAGAIYQYEGIWMADGVLSDVTELHLMQEELEEYRDWLEDMVDERTSELKLSNDLLRREIAERQQAEQELMKLAINLKRSNTELEQFAHVASHDLKEPLLLIIAFSERLINRCGDALTEKGREYLNRILKAANEMQQLVDGLLQLSRVTTGARPFETIDLNDLLEEVLQDLEETINTVQGEIRVDTLHRLNGDRIQMRQLLQNIIKNSLKYHKELESPHVLISSRMISGGFCEIIIEDNGIGFDEKYAERIFQPFERLHNATRFEGTGIGLATCKKIVMRHGGEISAKSMPGKGTTFIIRLPVHQKRPEKSKIERADEY